MTRPSKNIDRQLLDAGRKLLPATGISGISVRALCKKAGVNLGMFNYHFGTMEKYIEALITEIYNEFYRDFTLESETGNDPMEKLRNAIISVAFFVRDNRMLVLVLVEEMIRGNKKLLNFAKKNMTKHISIVFKLLAECQKQGYAVKSSIFAVAPILIGGVVLPNMAVRVLEKNYGDMFFGAAVPFVKSSLLSDKAIIERVDLVLRAISTEKKDEK